MRSESIAMQPSEADEIRELHRMLNLGAPTLVGPQDERINLPESVYHLLKQVVATMMRGKTIVLTPENERLTTQAAANFLGVSRPHLVKLLDSGSIPFEKVGQHRRVNMKDIATYRKHRDAERRSALNELARAEFADGSYEGLPIPEGGSDE
jgi:excisionase family DNA binding protein